MRILHITSGWPPIQGGGAEAYVARLTDEQREQGHTVGAVTLGVQGPDVAAVVRAWPHRLDEHRSADRLRRAAFHGLDVWRPGTAAVVRRAMATFSPDVVHSHVVAGMSVAALAAPAHLNTPHVHTLHDYWLRCVRSTATKADQRPCGPTCGAIAALRGGAVRRRGPTRFIAISRAIAEAHARLISAPVEVHLHPADPAAPRRRRAATLPVFGFLGQLNPNKGIQLLLDAARRCADDHMRFVVAGRGRLDAQVDRCDLPQLEYRGWVEGPAKERFFADIDCLIVPSLWAEPAGLVVREAAVRGVPVIAADIGGLPEYVPSSCAPLLFPAGDVDTLLERMRDFAAAPERYQPDPAAVPTWAQHVEDLVAVYRRAGVRHHLGRTA